MTSIETEMNRVQKLRDPYFNEQIKIKCRKRKQDVCKRIIRSGLTTTESRELFTELNYKDLYRRSLLEIKDYEEKRKEKTKHDVNKQMVKCNQNDEHSSRRENGNKLSRFIIYLATDHETLLQILLLLPLILMSLYILVIEKGTLFRVGQ